MRDNLVPLVFNIKTCLLHNFITLEIFFCIGFNKYVIRREFVFYTTMDNSKSSLLYIWYLVTNPAIEYVEWVENVYSVSWQQTALDMLFHSNTLSWGGQVTFDEMIMMSDLCLTRPTLHYKWYLVTNPEKSYIEWVENFYSGSWQQTALDMSLHSHTLSWWGQVTFDEMIMMSALY